MSPSVCLLCRINLRRVEPVSVSKGAEKWDQKVAFDVLLWVAKELGREAGGATLILAITVRGVDDKMVARAGRP